MNAKSRIPGCKASGQAMIEFVIALVAIIVIFTGLLQIGLLGAAQTESMMQARRDAGRSALQDDDLVALPQYVQDWRPGSDGSLYSEDDVVFPADPGDLPERILANGRPVELEQAVGGNPFSRMAASALPHFDFAFKRGYDRSPPVPVFPAIRRLVYDDEEITFQSEVWIPWTKGIY